MDSTLARRVGRLSITAATAAVGIAIGFAPAYADAADVDDASTAIVTMSAAGSVTGTAILDTGCQQDAIANKFDAKLCVATTSADASAATVATSSMLANAQNLVSSDGVRLGDLAVQPNVTIWTRTWSESKYGMPINATIWKEKHSGRIYWDGTHVWGDSIHYGFEAYHFCDEGFGFPYSIVVTTCRVTNDYNHYDQNWDNFQVHFVYGGFPIYLSYSMHVNAYASGSLYFH
jgi:hypothetical protein